MLAVVPAWFFVPLLGETSSWLTASWVAETSLQTSVVLHTVAVCRSDFPSEVLPFSMWHVGKWRAYCVFAATGPQREDEMMTDVSRQYRPMSTSTDKQTADRREPMHHQARLCPATTAISAVSLPNVPCSALLALVVSQRSMQNSLD